MKAFVLHHSSAALVCSSTFLRLPVTLGWSRPEVVDFTPLPPSYTVMMQFFRNVIWGFNLISVQRRLQGKLQIFTHDHCSYLVHAWLEYCRCGVKHNRINQSTIKQGTKLWITWTTQVVSSQFGVQITRSKFCLA